MAQRAAARVQGHEQIGVSMRNFDCSSNSPLLFSRASRYGATGGAGVYNDVRILHKFGADKRFDQMQRRLRETHVNGSDRPNMDICGRGSDIPLSRAGPCSLGRYLIVMLIFISDTTGSGGPKGTTNVSVQAGGCFASTRSAHQAIMVMFHNYP